MHFYTSGVGVDLFCPLPSLKETLGLQVSRLQHAHSLHSHRMQPSLPHEVTCLVSVITTAPSYRGKGLSILYIINLILPTTPWGRCAIIFVLFILQMKKLRYRLVKSFTQAHELRSTMGRNETHSVWLQRLLYHLTRFIGAGFCDDSLK